MTLMEFRRKVNAVLAADYEHETPDVVRSKKFNQLIKKMLVETFPEAEVIPTKGAWCSASGFLKFNGACIYYNFQDYRYWDWTEQILYRTAKDEHDYHGDANNYTDLYHLREDVCRLVKRAA